jgi:hypothetical protein
MSAIGWGLFLLSGLSVYAAGRVAIIVDGPLDPPARHGLTALQQALQAKGLSSTEQSPTQRLAAADFVIQLGLHCAAPLPAGREALAVRRSVYHGKPAVTLCASDARGLMYAELDTADRISWAAANQSPFAQVRDTSEAPYVGERGVSMYTMQRAYFESRLYDEEQWKRYFDMQARSRINNFLVIFGYENGGFLAPPYPYFFDVEGFPDVRLIGITPQQQARNVAAFNAMIRIAHERGIDVMAGIWDHIYRGGVQGGGIPGASENAGKRVPGLVWGLDEKNLGPYTNAALQRFLETFPQLDGVQFRMHSESGLKPAEMQPFWHKVFATIKQLHPNLRIDLRAKDLPDAIIEDALTQGLNARVSTKYWMEQMGLPFHPTHVNRENQHDRRHGYADLLRYPQRYPVHWTLWTGGTARLLLWADPDYVRRFAATVHLYNGNSFDVNEMLATKMLGEPHDEPPLDILNPKYRYYDYEFERYWHFYQVWGRLSYNPNTPPEVWEREFQRRFGRAATDAMNTLHLSSQVLPRIVAASYRYQLFPTTRGWAEMMRQGNLAQYADEQGSDVAQFMNVRDEARRIVDGGDTAMRRPEDTSRWFAKTSAAILGYVKQAEQAASAGGNELLSTLTDAKILAWLAEYHAWRLRTGVSYSLYKQTSDLVAFDDAIAHERKAVSAWEQVVQAAGDVYSRNLAFGAHAVGFSRHWSEELLALRRGLEDLEAQRRAAQPVIAHVPAHPADAASNPPGITLQPCPRATPGHDLTIAVRAQSPANLKSLRLRYRHLTQFEDYEAQDMKLDPRTGLYAARIPGAFITPQWDLVYYVEAIGSNGQGRIYPDLDRETPYVVVAVQR